METESALQIVDKSLHEADKIVIVTPNQELAKRLAKLDTVHVILEEKREGKAAAMNKLLDSVEHGILVYASGDVMIGGDAISELAAELRNDPGCGAVISHVMVANRNQGLMGMISNILWGLFNGVSSNLDKEARLAQANDLYAFRRELVGNIPDGTINDDTFLASSIVRKGFSVKVARVKVHVAGPTTPADYLVQRSRIVIGHIQTIKRLGLVPTVFEFTMASSPLSNLKIFVRTIAKGGLPSIVAACMMVPMEELTWVYAMALSAARRDVKVWKQAVSTKNVLSHVEGELV
ncbi:MAG: glycosyltransferase [Nitrososphaerota archaeon]|nr:glycosyltransferase [Nitrososphaerota archaeon]